MITTIRRAALAAAVLGLAACGGSQATTSNAAGGEAAPAAAAYDAPVSLELKFKYHVEDNLHEQDVFIEKDAGSGQVFRVTKSDKNMGMSLFASAKPIKHNPFDLDDKGPYDKGRDLGITLGKWFEAEGSATYTCKDGQGHIKAEFSKLIPSGVYTMWHFFMAMPPTKPFIGTYDLPIGERDGSQSVINADAEGKASFEQTFKPCLQLSGEHLAGGLALAWHSDGKTYGVEPGDFGENSHIQLYVFLPPRAGL